MLVSLLTYICISRSQWVYLISASTDTCSLHYDDVIMDAIVSQITSLTSVYSDVKLGAHQIKYQSSASLAFVRGIHRRPMNSPHKWPVTRKIFPSDDVIMSFAAFLTCRISALWNTRMCHFINSTQYSDSHIGFWSRYSVYWLCC